MSTINLLPEDYLKRRMQRRANVLCLALFAVVVAAVGAAALVSDQSTRHTLQVARDVKAQYLEATKLIEQLKQLEDRKQRMLHKAQLTARLLERVPRSTLLAVVANALPRQASLTKFQIVPKQVFGLSDPTPPSGKPKTKFEKLQKERSNPPQATVVYSMEATGLAGTDLDVAKFLANLVGNPLLTNVDLVYSQEKSIESKLVREFQVRMELKNDIDVIDVIQNAGKENVGNKTLTAGAVRDGENL